MSNRFEGKQYKGALRADREQKRVEADERNAKSAHLKEGRKLRDKELDPEVYTEDGFRRVLR